MKMSKRAPVMAIVLTLSLVAAALAIAADTRAVNDRATTSARSQTVLQSMDQLSATSRFADESRSDMLPSHAVAQDPTKTYTADELAYYLSADDLVYIRPGLNIAIQSVTIPADRRPVVTFQMTDDKGQPLDRAGVLTPGAVSTSFILAYLPPTTKGEVTDYVAYTTRTVTSPITNVKAIQAGADSPAGTYTPSGLNDGVYTYRFTTVLPANYNTAATTTLGIYATRNLTEFGLTLYVSDVTKDFVPNGAAVTQRHQVVLTANCNQCHDPLAAHGETGRRTVEICILCHNPGVIDPDTGNTVDMKVMIHKIHMGDALPSVVAGTPYVIIGNAQRAVDFSDVTYPQDQRNCQTCHKGAAQVNAYVLQPTIEACGSCHDDVNFATGANHAAGAYTDNSQCASCHQPQGQLEYDPSVLGAHTVPYKSTQLKYPKINFISLTNTAPGQNPVLQFTITDKSGNLMPLAQFGGSLGRLSANFSGPTSDYGPRTQSQTESITPAPAYVNGVATYTFKYAIPTTATGTWALELEGRITTTIIKNGDPKDTIAQRDAADNVVKYFGVTDKTPVPRRTVVSTALCNQCHDKLQLHGGNRNQTEACTVCHIPSLVAGTGSAAESVSFQVMVHRIHTGVDETTPYIIGSTNFQEVTYPGDRRDCARCHVGTSYTLPLPSTNIAVTTPKNFWSPTLPATAACLACHDAVSTAAHAFINTTTLGGKSVESCEVCHKESADFAVTKVHAR